MNDQDAMQQARNAIFEAESLLRAARQKLDEVLHPVSLDEDDLEARTHMALWGYCRVHHPEFSENFDLLARWGKLLVQATRRRQLSIHRVFERGLWVNSYPVEILREFLPLAKKANDLWVAERAAHELYYYCDAWECSPKYRREWDQARHNMDLANRAVMKFVTNSKGDM